METWYGNSKYIWVLETEIGGKNEKAVFKKMSKSVPRLRKKDEPLGCKNLKIWELQTTTYLGTQL